MVANKPILLVPLLLAFTGCVTNNDCYTFRQSAPYSIQFQITGTANSVDLLLVVEDTRSDTTRLEDVILPWTKELTREGDTWVYLAAQNKDSVGTLTTTLSINEEEMISDTQSGPSAISSIRYTILGEDYMVEVLECP